MWRLWTSDPNEEKRFELVVVDRENLEQVRVVSSMTALLKTRLQVLYHEALKRRVASWTSTTRSQR